MAVHPVCACHVGPRAHASCLEMRAPRWPTWLLAVLGCIVLLLPASLEADLRAKPGTIWDDVSLVLGVVMILAFALLVVCPSLLVARQTVDAVKTLRDERRCKHCGYLLQGLPEPRCPECGTPFDPAVLRAPEDGSESQPEGEQKNVQ